MINRFRGEYRFLSSFWPAEVELEGLTFPTVEHAYQAAKTTNVTLRKSIARLPTPGIAKRAGRGLPLREDWEEIKLGIMENLVRQKFTLHDDLKHELLGTGDEELVEGNNWRDTFWGMCGGVGKNHLGKILMKIRDELREGNAK